MLSNTADNSSASTGKGSKATLYDGTTLVGAYTLSQLVAGDAYLSFSANTCNGAWIITCIDNLSITLISDYDAWPSSLGLTGGTSGDDDQNDLNNLEEYAFGLNPESGSSIQPYLSFPAPATGTSTYNRRKERSVGWTSSSGHQRI